MKMTRGQESKETHPKRLNARYQMNWANIFFQKVLEKNILGQIFGYQRAEIDARKAKMNRFQ